MQPNSKSPRFTTTHWSVVLLARGKSQGAAESLEHLCATYWLPLYAFLRHQGHPRERAEDLTQGFFHQLISTDNSLASIHPSKGRFRNFLLASLKHYAANEYDKESAQKRGGGATVIHWDGIDLEARYKLEPATDLTPEKLFDRQWAMTLLEQAFEQLRDQVGRQEWFDAVKPLLVGDRLDITYKELAEKLGASEGALKIYVHRLRQSFAHAIREVVSTTVDTPEQVEEEIRELLLALQ